MKKIGMCIAAIMLASIMVSPAVVGQPNENANAAAADGAANGVYNSGNFQAFSTLSSLFSFHFKTSLDTNGDGTWITPADMSGITSDPIFYQKYPGTEIPVRVGAPDGYDHYVFQISITGGHVSMVMPIDMKDIESSIREFTLVVSGNHGDTVSVSASCTAYRYGPGGQVVIDEYNGWEYRYIGEVYNPFGL